MGIIMSTEDIQEVNSKMRDAIYQLCEDQENVQAILDGLKLSWMQGEDIRNRLELIIHRFRLIIVFLEYLSSGEKWRSQLLEKLELTGSKEAGIFDRWVERYSELEQAVDDYFYYRGGTLNHMLRFGPEGVFYDVERKIVLVQFSIYSDAERLVQIRNHVDDVIWLATNLIEVTNHAIKACSENKSPLSENYVENLKRRLKQLTEVYQEFEDLINNYVTTPETELSSAEPATDLDLEAASPAGVPDVDLSVEEEHS